MWWREAALRRSALGVLRTLVPSLVVVAVAAVFGAGPWWTATVLAVDDVAVADATVVATTIGRENPPMVVEATVRFDVAGRPRESKVLLREDPTLGESLRVRYSIDRPSHARVEGSAEGTTLLVLVTGVAAVAGAGFAALRVGLTIRRHRHIYRLLREPATPWRYQRFRDARGVPGVALFSSTEADTPSVVVPLLGYSSGPVEIPKAADATVHGEVRDGARVVPVVVGVPLWPLGPALALPASAARELVEGNRIPELAHGVWPRRRLRDIRLRLPLH